MTLVLAAFLLSAPVTLEADPAHSSASFSVKHMMVSTVHGQFAKVNSTLNFDKQDPSKTTVEVKIDPASIDTRNEKRDGHLKSADFFDVQKCPDLTFKSNKVKKSGSHYQVTGDLTMHCQTHPLTLQATFTDHPSKLPTGAMVYGADVSGKLKRSEWGLTWNKAVESGGVVVSDDVNLDISLEYGAKPEAQKKEAQAETEKKK
jgi:polyisoprenoid-binding protein YceI